MNEAADTLARARAIYATVANTPQKKLLKHVESRVLEAAARGEDAIQVGHGTCNMRLDTIRSYLVGAGYEVTDPVTPGLPLIDGAAAYIRVSGWAE